MINNLLGIIGSLTWIIVFGMFAVSALTSLLFLRRKRERHYQNWPSVSILKPCKGFDPGFEENIRSFFHIDYPSYEIIFAVADANDPAIPIIERSINRFPQIPAKLVIGSLRIGPNPKVNNLFNALGLAKHEHLVISDSNIRVNPNYLRNMIEHLRDGVGLVCSPVVGVQGHGIGGAIEEVFLNSSVLRWLLFADQLDRSIPLGKSMLLTRKTLSEIGGLKSLSSYIAEDFMAGYAVRQLGLKVVTSSEVIFQFIGEYSLSKYWARHLRWGRIRKVQTPALFWLEPLHGCLVSGLIGAFSLGGNYWAEFLVLHMIAWFSLDFAISNQISPRSSWRFILPWMFREFSALPHWLHSASSNSVQWRNQSLRLQRGGFIKETS